MLKRSTFQKIGLLVVVMLGSASAIADEGMWLYNAFPTARVKANYRFTVTQPFLNHLRLSSVRLGGSGSFVSPDGLILANYHAGAGCPRNASTGPHDGMHDAFFYAPTRAQEPPCPGIEIQNLLDIRDVTSDVLQAAKPSMSGPEAEAAQRAAMVRLEGECSDPSKNIRCETVTLYSGSLYHLYKYKKYTDVRLVMAPEFDAANFGGDPEAFTYPRYALDMTFFRAYENDKPVHVENYLHFATVGVKEGDLVFVSGHPVSTRRMLTVSQLDFQREVGYPARIQQLKQNIDMLLAFSGESPGNAEAAERALRSAQNSLKTSAGYSAGLNNAATMARKKSEESKLRKDLAANPKLKDSAIAWDEIAAAMRWQRDNWKRLTWQSDAAIPGNFANYARTLVRLAGELPQPSDRRLREYQEQNIPSIENALKSTTLLSRALEIRQLTLALTSLRENLGRENDFVEMVLAGKTPSARATELINGTHLDDPAFRKELYKGGRVAIDAAADPMVVFIRQIDPIARATRRDAEEHIESVVRKNGARIAKARFALYGTNEAPDATGTLRLSYGSVKGYTENGRKIPWNTSFLGAFGDEAAHATKPPYQLPASYQRAKDKLELNTVLDTVNTADSIGGNSGSAVVNTKGEIVGIAFDGNLQSLPWSFQFEDETGRTVVTDSRAIIESLRKIYNAAPLVKELMPPGKK